MREFFDWLGFVLFSATLVFIFFFLIIGLLYLTSRIF